ncbi:MAG: hypothetical protein M1814_001301 [Vezdaea aestivalis]|nr:MAG: hypothetical protein M1814_001301 [Vezdaea aestivalis]
MAGHTEIKNICCIGAGYVGGPTSAVIALKNPQIQVTVVDLNESRIAAWNSSSPPIYEPGLQEILKSIADRAKPEIENATGNTVKARLNGLAQSNLTFSTKVDEAITAADVILISVNTPTKLDGRGQGFAADVSLVERAARQIARASHSYKIVVEKSTVPCKTADSIQDIVRIFSNFDKSRAFANWLKLLSNANKGADFDVLSNPEFLAEGTAIKDLLYPDRVLIGSYNDARGLQAANVLKSLYLSWVPPSKIIQVNVFSSELAKLAANALLAQRISSVNSLSAICEKTGADIDEVTRSCGLDSRIGSRMLKSSGFGGSCFRKDVLSLVYLAQSLHLPEVARYWQGVVEINEYQKRRFSERIISNLFSTIKGKKIAILGFAYKKDTGDARETAAVTLIKDLLAEEARIHVYDPRVSAASMLAESLAAGVSHSLFEAGVRVEDSPYDACQGADAILILTEWDMFRNGSDSMELDESKDADSGNAQGPQNDGRGNGPSSPATQTLQSCDANDYSTLPTDAVLGDGFGKHMPRKLDWARIAVGMKKPMFVFDGRNILDRAQLTFLGFRVESIGRSKAGPSDR